MNPLTNGMNEALGIYKRVIWHITISTGQISDGLEICEAEIQSVVQIISGQITPWEMISASMLDPRLFVALAFLWARAMRPPHAPASRKVRPLAGQFSAVARGL